MARRIVKINSNPNKTPAKGKRNPTEQAEGEYDYYWNVVAEKYGHKEQPKETKKINSNPVKAGKTKVSPMAKVRKPGNFRGRGGVIGGGFLDQLK